MKWSGMVSIIVAVIVGTIGLRYADRLFPTLTAPPKAVPKIF